MSPAWANASINYFENEKMKIAQAESSFAQKARNELVEIETKLDRLLDLQLDGNLSQAEYTAKKHKLILAKKDLEEKITAFGRKSNNRFELAIAFLKEANQAEKYAQQENPESFRDFLKKIGSNFRIADRTLVLDLKNAFKIAEKYHAEALCAEAVSYDFTKSENWRRERDSNITCSVPCLDFLFVRKLKKMLKQASNPSRKCPRHFLLSAKQKGRLGSALFCTGGERGIRTLDTVSDILPFQGSPFDRSGISPCLGEPCKDTLFWVNAQWKNMQKTT